MHIAKNPATAAIGLALILLSSIASSAAIAESSLPPAPRGAETAVAQADNSKPYPENVAVQLPRKPSHRVKCFDDPLHQADVMWFSYLGDDVLPAGSKVEITLQPGNKKVRIVVPFDLHYGWAFELPHGTRPDAQRVSCAVTQMVIITP